MDRSTNEYIRGTALWEVEQTTLERLESGEHGKRRPQRRFMDVVMGDMQTVGVTEEHGG